MRGMSRCIEEEASKVRKLNPKNQINQRNQVYQVYQAAINNCLRRHLRNIQVKKAIKAIKVGDRWSWWKRK
jgi:hypothetical protein